MYIFLHGGVFLLVLCQWYTNWSFSAPHLLCSLAFFPMSPKVWGGSCMQILWDVRYKEGWKDAVNHDFFYLAVRKREQIPKGGWVGVNGDIFYRCWNPKVGACQIYCTWVPQLWCLKWHWCVPCWRLSLPVHSAHNTNEKVLQCRRFRAFFGIISLWTIHCTIHSFLVLDIWYRHERVLPETHAYLMDIIQNNSFNYTSIMA